jgi:hypothetical protein
MRFKIDPANYDSCPEFNEWIDSRHAEEHGELQILSFTVRPSYVLHQLNYATYEAALADFISSRQEDLKETVFQRFPAPIAYYFYRFENGFENDLQRLHLLRDTWEATIDVLHSLVIGECRFQGLDLSAVPQLKHHDLYSDRVDDRLLTLERVLDYALANGIVLATATAIPGQVIAEMRELNRSRNAFSHSAAQSDVQARVWIGECLEDVLDVLDQLRNVADVILMRYRAHENALTLRCEVFRGHALTRTIQTVKLTNDQAKDCQQYFYPDQMIALCGKRMFGLRPFMFFQEDASGHVTRPCVFRKAVGDSPNRKIRFGIVGPAESVEVDRALFKQEIDELRSLFGLAPE